jgi:hypothetical protein
LMLQPSIGGWAWFWAATSGISRAAQAMSYESARRNYRRWVYGLNWIRQDVGKAANAGPAGRIGAALASLYLWAAQWVRADDSEIEAVMARLSAAPRSAAAARALYQEKIKAKVKQASWLSTNWETLGVFASLMLFRSPLEFLVFQAVALNLWMVWCVAQQRHTYRRLLPQLERLAGG